MGKNQGFLSVNLSKARDNSTWAVSWLAELTVTPSPLPPFSPSPPCVRLKNLRVWSQNVPVCTGTTPACGNTCARGAGTHGDVLNLHTEVFSACQAAPHTTPHTQHTHTTQHTTQHNTTHTHTHTHHTTPQHTTPHGDRDTETETDKRRETERDRERDRERETRQDKTRKDETIKEKKLEDGRGETRR